MDNLLEIDLNEFVSKSISDKIADLEKQLKDSYSTIAKQRSEIDVLKKEVEKSHVAIGLLDYLRLEFAKIQRSEEDKGGWYDSKHKNQYIFIENALLNIFNIKKEAGGWYCHRNDGSLMVHLAVNFYSQKETVINLLMALMPECGKEVAFIKSFKMPYDYTKEDVVEYVKNPQYNTNGCIFGINEYWINNGAGKLNMPHDLIMKNKHILEEEVFSILLNSIKKQVSNHYYLFALPKYNKSISQHQLEQLGEMVTKLTTDKLKYTEVESFISENLKQLNEATLDYMYKFISSDNHFKALDWTKFPNHYQMKFLKSKPLDEVLRILTNYSCTWTMEQKQGFLKEYTN